MTRSVSVGQTEMEGRERAVGRGEIAQVTRRTLMAGAAVLAGTGPVTAGPTFDAIEREAHERPSPWHGATRGSRSER
jgi:hypothetical protein